MTGKWHSEVVCVCVDKGNAPVGWFLQNYRSSKRQGLMLIRFVSHPWAGWAVFDDLKAGVGARDDHSAFLLWHLAG
jgi:hypothetical protein